MSAEILLRSYSGVRFLTRHADSKLLRRYALALGEYIGTRRRLIIIGRDTRPISKRILRDFFSSLGSLGFDVVYAGICPTPTVQVLVTETGAAAGVMLTASHNPQEWGGFKFIRPDGIFYSRREINEIYGMCDRIPENRVPPAASLKSLARFDRTFEVGKGVDFAGEYGGRRLPAEFQRNAMNIHLRRVLRSVSAETIAGRRFNVIIDSGNGAGSVITPVLLRALGCNIREIFTDPDGFMRARKPEPVPENLSKLYRAAGSGAFDAGFAQDSDADRLAFCTETGAAVNEELTLALAILSTFSKLGRTGGKTRGITVTNVTSSRSIDAVVAGLGGKLIKTRVGEVNIAETMKRTGAHVGGEGNGGVINPSVHLGRDSLVAAATILELMAERGRPLSRILEEIPVHHPVKLKFERMAECDKKRIIEIFAGARVSRIDGLRLDLPDRWISIRDSNTEPVTRVIGESETEEGAAEMKREIERLFG